MQQGHVTDLIPAYALGALEPDEVEMVDIHLETCAACAAEASLMSRVTEELPLAVPQLDAPARVRVRLLERVRSLPAEPSGARAREEPPRQHVPAARDPQQAPSASAQGPQGNRVQRMLQALFGAPATRDALDRDTERMLLETLAAPELAVLAVDATAAAPGASARLISAPNSGEGILISAGLPTLPTGKAYQVWLLRDGKPAPNALFTLDDRRRGVRVVRASGPLTEYDLLAVTPEPVGGSPAPTGEIVLAGALR